MPETGFERSGGSKLCDLGLGNGSFRLMYGRRMVILHERVKREDERVRREDDVNDGAAALGRVVSASEVGAPTGD